jgi:hypothetical protein
MAFWNKKTHDDPIAEAIALTPLPFGGRSVTAREVRSKKWIDQSYMWELVRGHLEVEEVEWATGTGRTDEGRSQFYVTTHRLLGIPLAKTGRFTTRTGAVPFATVATVQVEPQGREIVVQIISSTNRDLETATPDEIFRDSFAFDSRTDEQKAFVGGPARRRDGAWRAVR